jgi:hypothetical protein
VTKEKGVRRAGPGRQKPEIEPAIIEELMKSYQRQEDLTGPGGIKNN